MSSNEIKATKAPLTIEPGDLFQDRDPRSAGRCLRVIEYGTKNVDGYSRGKWMKRPVECVICEVLGTTRRVKISQHTLSRRYRKVTA